MFELVRENRARMRGVERQGVLPDFAVGVYVLATRVRQPGIAEAHEHAGWTVEGGIENRRARVRCGGHLTGRTREVHIMRMRPYADASLNVTVELKGIFSSLTSQIELGTERTETVNLVADSEKYVANMKWVGLDEDNTTWEPVPTIYMRMRWYSSVWQ